MVKRGVKFTFPPELIKEPIIYNLGQRFKVVTNIRRADINGDKRLKKSKDNGSRDHSGNIAHAGQDNNEEGKHGVFGTHD